MARLIGDRDVVLAAVLRREAHVTAISRVTAYP